MKRISAQLINLLIICAIFGTAKAQVDSNRTEKASFAIFVDDQTFAVAQKEILAYKKSVEKQGLACQVFADKFENPTILRQKIQDVYKKNGNLEGVVFIGDIPIPMLRDAQHLTSAFKIDQSRYSMQRTSVPSDVFYEDFDLKFKFVGQDTANPLLFYYSLLADSPQKVEKEIYSGRIFPPVSDSTRYEKIRHFLKKLVKVKNERRKLSKALFFTGHGYHSESLDAWASEALALREQFPQLYLPGRRLYFYNHSMSPNFKNTLLQTIVREPIDLAVFHAHGAEDTQYLLGNPPAETIKAQIEAVKYFLRSKLRSAKRRKKSIAELKLNYMERFDIPLDWFDGAFDDSVMRADSLKAAKMDIYSEDVRKISPGAKVILFDECFNGAFIEPAYLAGEYLFNEGETVAAFANSVNVLQDIWADEFLGLIGTGARIGLVHRLNPYLEAHILGDPTFQFSAEDTFDINKLLGENVGTKQWKELLASPNILLAALSVFRLSELEGKDFAGQFQEMYRTNGSFIVRGEIFRALAKRRDAKLEKLIFQSINDPCEFIRRKSALLMGDIGNEKFVTPLLRVILSDPSERVVFTAKTALAKMAISKNKMKKYYQELSGFSETEIEKILKSTAISRAKDIKNEYLPKLKNVKLPLRKRISGARFFRNYRFHEAVPELIAMAGEKSLDEEVRAAIIEALGWFQYSYQRGKIIDFCEKLLSRSNERPSVINEARKTRLRLIAGPNHSLTP